MALIKCVECEKEFSDKAQCCPNCGCPTEYVLSEISKMNHKSSDKVYKINLEKKKEVKDKFSDKKIYDPKSILDCSKMGDYKSEGCRKSFEKMYECLNNNEKLSDILGLLNDLAKNNSNWATQEINKDLIDKVIVNNLMTSSMESYEIPLFYKDNAVLFYGKDGILITNKALYRIKKNRCKKIFYSELKSINLSDVFKSKNECMWYFNKDLDFYLSSVAADSNQLGLIMALVCLAYYDAEPDGKIMFYNYI